MISNKKTRKRRCFRRSTGFPHIILFWNKTRQPFSQAGRTSVVLFSKKHEQTLCVLFGGFDHIKAYRTLFTLYIEVRTSQFWGKKVPMFQ